MMQSYLSEIWSTCIHVISDVLMNAFGWCAAIYEMAKPILSAARERIVDWSMKVEDIVSNVSLQLKNILEDIRVLLQSPYSEPIVVDAEVVS